MSDSGIRMETLGNRIQEVGSGNVWRLPALVKL